MAVSIAFLGGRPAMISAATGAIALVIAPVVRDHGLDYLIATVILGGVFQVLLGVLGVAKLMRFIPRSVMVGFVAMPRCRQQHGGGRHVRLAQRAAQHTSPPSEEREHLMLSTDVVPVAALDAIQTKFEPKGKHVDIVGLNQASAHMHDRLSGHLGGGH